MKYLGAFMAMMVLTSCQNQSDKREDLGPIIFREDDKPCVKNQREFIGLSFASDTNSIEELLNFLLGQNEAQKMTICTKS